eukprot:759115-Hanusia_phi.AAC.2
MRLALGEEEAGEAGEMMVERRKAVCYQQREMIGKSKLLVLCALLEDCPIDLCELRRFQLLCWSLPLRFPFFHAASLTPLGMQQCFIEAFP